MIDAIAGQDADEAEQIYMTSEYLVPYFFANMFSFAMTLRL